MFYRETNTLNLWGNRQNTRFYEDIREFNSSNIKDFRGRLKSWIKMGMLAGRIFYLKDMWARDVAALTFASFMAMIPFMAMMFVIARGFGYASLLESWLSTTFEAQPVVAQTIVNFVHNYIENTQSNYIIGTGIVMFLYTIVSLMQKIELTFDDIWHTGERSWRQIVTEYPTILFGLGLLILFASSINVWTVNMVDNVDRIADIGDTIPSFILHLAAFVPMFLFFVFCYYVIPNTYIRVRSTLVIVPGGCLHDGTSVWIYLSAGFSVQLQCHLWFAGSHSAFPVMASDFVGYRSVWPCFAIPTRTFIIMMVICSTIT